MSRKAVINRNNKRKILVERYATKRAELRKILKDKDASYEEKMDAQHKLQKLPRDSCAARYRNRCRITGRPRGVFRRFSISRGFLRDLAMSGQIPGVTKSSW